MSRTRPLWRFYMELVPHEAPYNQKGIEILDEVIENLDEYTGHPDLWHNTAMGAARVRHHDAELAIVQSGLREWPGDIDLLCDELQIRHTTSYDPKEAKRIWKELENTDVSSKKCYWRYWVHGAIYHASELRDTAKAQELLNNGLCCIKRDSLMDIFRSYRRILIDGVPAETLTDSNSVEAYQRRVLAQLEEYYKQGLQLGVENSYVLATDLARLYQEQAAVQVAKDGNATDKGNNFLERALYYLDLAEKLYTGSANHPIWEVYVVKARILMALHKYGEALVIFRSLPKLLIESDTSLQTMLNLATRMAGEKIEETPSSEMISKFLSNPDDLYKMARESPSILMNLFKVARRIQEETTEKPNDNS